MVANNNQIVTGVSNGVAEANKNTERLLQKLIEQNERLLRKNTSLMMNSKKVNKELSREVETLDTVSVQHRRC